MKNRIVWALGCLWLCMASVRGEPTWFLEHADVPNLSADGAEGNPVAQPTALGALGVIPETPKDQAGAVPLRLPEWEVGYAQERAQPQYWLGESIEPPEGVDWAATEALWAETEDTAGFLLDAPGKALYVTQGGSRVFTWVLSDGSRQEIPYVLGDVSATRPLRIFWTDSPYNAPQVDLTGKFVRFYGDPNVLTLEKSVVTNVVSGIEQEVTKVTKGLYLDETTHMLSALGKVEGQVVMAYYTSGNFDQLKKVVVVEVARPQVIELTGTIGKALAPSGGGYESAGLTPFPQAPEETDNRGPYYYQHKGQNSYSPKHNNVYPLRPTVGESWRLPVYWMEYDAFDTLWPFELCHYACDWGDDTQIFVRGDDAAPGLPLYLPKDYTVTLMKYQTPEGHARLNLGDNALEVSLAGASPAEKAGQRISGEGYSLLRLTADDNIWFLPIRSVLRSKTSVFPDDVAEWPVGTELSLRQTEAAKRSKADATASGYLYAAASGDNYNAALYHAPEPDNPVGIDPGTDDSGTLSTNEAPSVIYAVAQARDPNSALEVWWMSTVQEEGMSTPIQVPSIPQRYRAVWPGKYDVPSIVIASQLGSANRCIASSGLAAQADSKDATIALPEGSWFADLAAEGNMDDGGGIAFWVRLPKTPTAEDGTFRLLTLGGTPPKAGEAATYALTVDGSSEGLEVTVWKVSSEGAREIGSAEAPERLSEGWNAVFVDLGVNYDPLEPFLILGVAVSTAEEFLAERPVYEERFIKGEEVQGSEIMGTRFTGNAMGAGVGALTQKTLAGAAFGRVAFCREWLDIEPQHLAEPYSPNDVRLSACLDVSAVGDGVAYVDAVTGLFGTAGTAVSATRPGSPLVSEGSQILASDTPVIYAQNDPSKPGYNPNEEHAFVQGSGEGYTVWALRCDLNTEETSEPGVLVQYTDAETGRPAMRWFGVELTSSVYPRLAGTGVAGTAVPGPHPLDYLPNPWMKETYWEGSSDETPFYRDRKLQLWFRRDGEAAVRMYYPMQEGFAFPSLERQPSVGSPIPWLSCVTEEDGQYVFSTPDGSVVSSAVKPCPWKWSVSWPESVPTLRVGQTLTVAESGLPEVWAAKSMAVLFPNDGGKTALLYDPTIARHPMEVKDLPAAVADIPEFFGFDTSDNGNALLRRGKYIFRDLPPSLSGRFYFDTTAGSVREAFCLIGEREANAAGAAVLYPNVPNAEEIAALKAIRISETERGRWEALISALPTEPEVRSTLSVTNANEILVDYRASDHYALTAMGGAAGYVTLIENDGPESVGVKEGDPISMHVIKVVPEYYAGRVIAREDPENLLSQQLSILYTESFAGKAGEYEFDWRKAAPLASGRVPDDFDNGYASVFGELERRLGLTRFVVGGQGDTLANMVNTYYAVRYRAKEGSTAYALMGDTWSPWCGPTLAEGWVQRVLNNVTPFTQRMQDLYDNKAETLTSMIQQAGGPYQGDVALNQENLTNVGLIQLYMTLLNKAESMSLALGTNDREANKQLLLAVERLADLYMVLGNEAYADALNPTIGFGSSSVVDSGSVSGSVDYGALSSSLFCFDNLMPSLLDEELALLRGRSGANAPATTIAPYFNRLPWNFTRGITAGEVAYAVNYNIGSTNGDAVIDEEDAVRQYPQGHGDAYGHYLSAIKGFYRLLRNPYFTWNVSMGEMLLADAVANVDYYDEQRFAEVAVSMADTAALVVDRTARKAYAEHGGGGAGYLDDDGARGFGYGEWGTRGGIAALTGWMVANSLLPESASNAAYWQLAFDGTTSLSNTGAMSLETLDGGRSDWTLEFQVADAVPYEGKSDPAVAQLLLWAPETGAQLSIELDGENGLTLAVGETRASFPVALPKGRSLLALSHTRETGDETGDPEADRYQLRVLDASGALVGSCHVDVPMNSATTSDNTLYGGTLVLGGETVGRLYEVRLWNLLRSTEELRGARAFVNPQAEGLVASLRTFSDEQPGEGFTFTDDTAAAPTWDLTEPQWDLIEQNGSEVSFSDSGLERIDRTTVTALTGLTEAMARIEGTVARLDMGLNPLGFSDSAIPFDLTPLGLEDGTSSHFEQVAERAVVALNNAATVLDRAQEVSTQLRLLEESRQINEDKLASQEEDYETQLIALFGTPYSDDIGPGKTYAQGYEGPDLINYAWMDLGEYGLTDIPTSDTNRLSVVSYDVPQWTLNAFLANYVNSTETAYTFYVRPDGLIQKPTSITGTRRAQGEIQQAYADFLSAYRAYLQAKEWYDRKSVQLEAEALGAELSLATAQIKLAALLGVNTYLAVDAAKRKALQVAYDSFDYAIAMSSLVKDATVQSVPKITGAGLTVNVDPSAVAAAALTAGILPELVSLYTGRFTVQQGITVSDYSWIGSFIRNQLSAIGDFVTEKDAARDRLVDYVEQQLTRSQELETAYVRLVAARENIKTVLERGQALLAERERYRARAVNKLTKSRYNDMFFRQVQHQALDRYEAAFSLAQKYVYLAAQVYDYETGLLSSDPEAGDAFRAEIVSARTLGELKDGQPTLAGTAAAPGLSDILARMKANWLVLKPRLGLNNPQRDTTWFSLRTELLRIAPGAEGDAAWRSALAARWVNDLSSVTGYAALCEPFSKSDGTPEPGIVIEFPSDITFARNFFGKPLSGGDAAYDPTYFATKIAGAGVRFEGYNQDLQGNPAANASLSRTPTVYLVPLGSDRMRVPGKAKDVVLDYAVKDQVVPLPYAIGSTHLDDPDWMPSYSGTTGGVDIASRIRRFPSFRAALNGDDSDSALRSTRLVGRSVWNTRWALIIPAGALGADREKALNAFIFGADSNHDGVIDTAGVRDIQLGFRTYSHAGN